MYAPRGERAATLERRCAINHKTIESRNRSSRAGISPRELAAPAAAAASQCFAPLGFLFCTVPSFDATQWDRAREQRCLLSTLLRRQSNGISDTVAENNRIFSGREPSQVAPCRQSSAPFSLKTRDTSVIKEAAFSWPILTF
ncbi:hypothetical protein CDAR_463171 [Caerostris darwini]|uniref:Uncharacterized protein n=1 Tax=Caerostris darwini TaxID=1538125 RepID=A0AAV4QAX9_9ARAC|nr:hypothetical protein CDAR_463171 [Caerostris darwini]